MKIGFDAKRVFQNNSGLGNYSRSTVDLLTRYNPENEYVLFTPTAENRVGYVVPQGVEVVMPTEGLMSRVPALWRTFSMSGDIHKRRCDIFHGLSNELPTDIRESGAKSIVTIHDLIFLRYPNLYKKIDRYLYEKKYKNSCEIADRVIAISNQTRDDLIEFWNIPPEQISVVYQGCNPIFYAPANQASKENVRKKYNLPQEYILSVGTIEERKNLMLTVKAMAAGKIDLPLVVCGRHTEYVQTVMDYARSQGIEERIQLHHSIDFADLPVIYQLASVSVYVSLFEGFGIPILESLNCGTPTITARGGVFPETGGNACIYVGQYDVEEMVEALQNAIYDQEKRQEMIEKGHAYALNFREEVVAQNLMEVYNNIL